MAGQGVFSLVCPDCGEPLLPHHGQVACAGCHRRFLARVGHLIPVDTSRTAASTSDVGGLG
jgi:uncharacterized Zn finger protein (UPF0148 family)